MTSPSSERFITAWSCLLVANLVAVGCSRTTDAVGHAGAASAPSHDTSSAPSASASAVRPDAPAFREPELGAPAPEPENAPPWPALRDEHIDWQANAVMARLGRIAETMTHSEYSHGLSVNEAKGIYKFDCSGMVYWLLRRAAPRAASALAYKLEHRPLARDIYRRIASVGANQPRHGWQRVVRVDELEPGDVIAWIKPAIIRSPNTGHTGFVVLPPEKVPEYDNAYLVRIADATSLLHDDDTRVGRNGFGMGTILLVSDPESGEPIAYGWSGLSWRAFETDIALGRPRE